MSYRLSVDVIGAKELEAAFRKAPELTKKELSGAIGKTAFKIEATAKQYAPVDRGNLRGSINTRGPNVTANNVEASVGTNVKYACVFDARTHVTTDKGSKTIGQIKVGDRVLTQAGDYQPVIAKNAFPALEKPELIEIKVEWRKGKAHTVTLTTDHKVLVYRDGRNKWVQAGELTTEDVMYTRIKLAYNKGTGRVMPCLTCGGKIPQPAPTRKHCSYACKVTRWNDGNNPHLGMKRSPDAKKRIRAALVERLRRRPETQINRLLAVRGHRTNFERAIEEWLQARGVAYETQKQIGRHFVDFYLPDSKIVLEADGSFWHKDQARDVARDSSIMREDPDVKIIHLHFFDPRFSPELDINPLPGAFYVSCNPGPDSYTDPLSMQRSAIVSLRRWTYGVEKKHRNDPRRAKLYDLTVANVHSFFANGILVSNSYQEEGTGIYGPRKQMIRPRTARVLAWSRGGQGFFARQVRGVPALRYFRRAREEGKPFLTDRMQEALKAIVSALAR